MKNEYLEKCRLAYIGRHVPAGGMGEWGQCPKSEKFCMDNRTINLEIYMTK